MWKNATAYEGKEAVKSHEAELTDIDHQKYQLINERVVDAKDIRGGGGHRARYGFGQL
jgi:hypothetical protein